jgi:hypothetical protein
MKKSFIQLLAVLFLLASVNVYSQTDSKIAGKIFTKEEANKLFGPVKTSIKMKSSLLQDQLKKVDGYIMFKIKDNDLVVADSKRNVLSTGKVLSLAAEEVMHMYSKSVVEELLEKGKSDYIIFEMRAEKFTVTNGAVTMEFAWVCPPMCD